MSQLRIRREKITETDLTNRKDLVENESDSQSEANVYDVEFEEDDDLKNRRVVERIPVEIH